jgi:hypothetical protein
MSMAAIGASVLGAGISVGGAALMSGSSGGSSSSGSTAAVSEDQMQKYLSRLKTVSGKTLDDIRGIVDTMQKQSNINATNYSQSSSTEAQMAGERLTSAAQLLNAQAGNLNANFSGDILKAIDDLKAASSSIDLEDRAATVNALDDYRREITELDVQARQQSGLALAKMDNSTNAAIGEYRGEANTIGDQFLNAATQAQQSYKDTMDLATSVDPARLDQFIQAADYLSKAAQRTRLDLIATADPMAQAMEQQIDEITRANISGQIDSTTAGNLARTSAFRALQGGYGASSDAGRGMTARDFGLQALDLQKQGIAVSDAERRRRFDHKVAGLQVDPNAMRAENNALLADRGKTLLATQTGVAESNRNQRMGALDKGFDTRIGAIGARATEELGINRELTGARMGAANNYLSGNLNNLGSIYASKRGVAGTEFNARSGLAESLYKTNIGLASDVFGASANMAGTLYSGAMQTAGNIYQGQNTAAANAANINAGAATNALNLYANALGSAAGTNVSAAQQDMLLAQQGQANSNAMWGSMLNTGAALAGDIFGSMYKTPTRSQWTPEDIDFYNQMVEG